jgi:hypothetical protein
MPRPSLLLLLLAIGSSEVRVAPQPASGARLKPAPTTEVRVRDVGGRSWSLLAPVPKQTDLLFFIATDCPISNRYVPEIARVCREYQPRGVRCFAIYPDAADAGAVRHHRQEYAIDAAIPAILDRDHRVVDAVGPRVTPEAAIYSTAGRVYRGRIDNLYIDVGRARREATQHDLRLALDASLAGRRIVQPETDAIGCVIQKP